MKLTKTTLCATLLGATMFAASNAPAVPTVLTVSGTALSQDYSKGKAVAKKHGIKQKDLLFLLAEATGDASITNKPTKIYYDPDLWNTNVYYSKQGEFKGANDGIYGTGFNFYGRFYYSNSVAGLKPLDGVDAGTNYYSYIEFDYNSWLLGDIATNSSVSVQGFWQPGSVEYNNILDGSTNKGTAYGNGILYVHSNPYDYNLPGNFDDFDGYPPYNYYANSWAGYYQAYALVIHGTLDLNVSFNSTQTKESESITLSGSGDGYWNGSDIVINGKANFSGKGANELF